MTLTLRQEETARRTSVPFARFEYVTVTFATANVDVDIVHTLRPTDPESVRWIAVSTESTPSAGVVYRSSAAARLPWSQSRVWLRCTHAGTVRLLLFLEADS